jgi:hypothetical protein
VNALTLCLISLGAGHKTFALSPESTALPPHSLTHRFLFIATRVLTIQLNVTRQSLATMNTGAPLPLALLSGGALTMGHAFVVDDFQTKVEDCVAKWRDGDNLVTLPENIHTRYGPALTNYFCKSLAQRVGDPVDFSVDVNNGNDSKTSVRMPEYGDSRDMPQSQLSMRPSTVPSEQVTLKAVTAAIVTKKAPRPMNCWIIFRDAMYKQLKGEHPHLSVQEICKHYCTLSPQT